MSETRDFEDGRRIVGVARNFIEQLEKFLPQIFQEVGSVASGEPFRLIVEPTQGCTVFVKFQYGLGWRIAISEGLILRLIGVLRLLLAYWGKTSPAWMIGSPADEFDSSLFWSPIRIAPIFDEAENLAALSKALESMSFTRPMENKAGWDDIEGMTNQALLYVICHEIAHATGRHRDLRDLAKKDFRLKDFGISEDDVTLSCEMEADIQGAQSFAFMTLLESTTERDSETAFRRLALRAGFAIPALLGLWDHHKKVLASYRSTNYPASVVRHQLYAENAKRVFQADPHHYAMWNEGELHGWKACVEAFQHVTFDLMEFGEASPPLGKIFWPIGSLNYGGWASQSYIAADYNNKMQILGRFRAWEAEVSKTLPERQIF